MDRLTQRLEVARTALESFAELATKHPRSKVERDAAIQRFEYTFEAVWKATQLYLREIEGIEAASPKRVVRAAFQIQLLDESEASNALTMADDRNLSVHTYNEQLAEEINRRLDAHSALIRIWIDRMTARILPHRSTPT